ncbi:fungal specific transcription factor [Zalerion maritima]|uniref:Fungal specific transcription factor n=1 Tax=Zalerion maritima TaxID=339359 RepID=A0AAD5RUX7_9PEZI|nr:fungal specific transcription factor [Zalerion maritima]
MATADKTAPDAVPKKRGPKTDVLEALLKRVDGLEAKLKEKNKCEGDSSPVVENAPSVTDGQSATGSAGNGDTAGKGDVAETSSVEQQPKPAEQESYSPAVISEPSPPAVQTDALLDTYFSRFHAKPYHILDESSVRQRLQLGQVPTYLVHAIYAVAARYTPHPSGYQSAVRLSEEYASRSRRELDTDESSIDGLQSLLLLVTAFTAAGKGKRAYMLLTNAVGMAMALELHREVDVQARITPVEREMRRRLFWSCYLLDRFMACGSKRPSLVADKNIMLRLPCWSPSPAVLPVEGELFQSGSNLQYIQGSGKRQGSSGMLIDISRILGITNCYLAAGGVKGDSHFPWHSLSNLSKIRQDLDVWASGTDDVFSSVDSLFGQADSTVLVLSKLVYHLIHCLVYRPFLPVDLSELAMGAGGQYQSWQIEATHMCFLHANAIAELVELGKQTAAIEWPAFVGFCICTAGTVHIHGAHYSKAAAAVASQDIASLMPVAQQSADFLSREMQQLSELRYAWASVQHQRETLQNMYVAHGDLVKKTLVNSPAVGNFPNHHQQSPRFSPAFHLEDFFDRYANQAFTFDAANLSLPDVIVDFTADAYSGNDLFAPRLPNHGQAMPDPSGSSCLGERPLKRRCTPSGRKRPNLKAIAPLATSSFANPPPTPALSTAGSMAGHHVSSVFATNTPTHPPPQPSPAMINTPVSLAPHRSEMTHQQHNHPTSSMQAHLNDTAANNAAMAAAAAAGFAISPQTGQPATPFTPQNFSFAQMAPDSASSTTMPPSVSVSATAPSNTAQSPGPYDPMFGTLPTNAFSSPAPWNGEPKNAPSPGSRSQGTGSDGAASEKDPFLSLLEQLAENEGNRVHGGGSNGGSEIDFFLAGPGGN